MKDASSQYLLFCWCKGSPFTTPQGSFSCPRKGAPVRWTHGESFEFRHLSEETSTSVSGNPQISPNIMGKATIVTTFMKACLSGFDSGSAEKNAPIAANPDGSKSSRNPGGDLVEAMYTRLGMSKVWECLRRCRLRFSSFC